MAEAPVYAPGGVPQTARLPGLDNGAAGFGLASDIGQAAGAIEANRNAERSTNVQLAQIEREGLELRETSAAHAALAQHQNDTDVFFAQQQQANGAAGGAGTAAAVAKYWDDGVSKILEGVTSPAVRARLLPSVAEASRVKSQAMIWESTAGVKRAVADLDVASNIQINRGIAQAHGGAGLTALDDVDKQLAGMIDSVPGQSADDKQKLLREKAAEARIAFNRATADVDPAAAMQQLEDPRFAILDPKVMTALRKNADDELHSQASQARAKAAADKALQMKALQTQQALLETGAGKPRDWGALADGFDAIGETDNAVRMRAKGAEMAATMAYRGESLPQLDAQITTLQAKRNGDGLSPAEATSLSGLSALREQQAGRLREPGGALKQYVFATGQTLAPINWSDPQSVRDRATVARAAAERAGQLRVEPLTDADVVPIKQAFENGPTGKMLALRMLAQLGDAEAIAGAAHQVSGAQEDAGFRVAATFMTLPNGEQVARDVLRGPDALKSNTKVFNATRAKVAFADYAKSMRGLPADMVADRFEAAKDLYASRMTALGHTDWDANQWAAAMDAGMGAYRQGGVKYGGTAQINGQRVVIPTGWTSDGLFRRIARAQGEDWNKAAGVLPVWPDHTTPTADQLAKLTPMWLGGTHYGLLTSAGRLLQAKNGNHYIFDAAKLPWR